MVGPALSTRLPFEDERATVLGETLDPVERAALVARLTEAGARFRRPGSGDAVDHAGLSRMAGWSRGRRRCASTLRAPPMAGSVMPGGFARVGLAGDATALAMQRGGQAADVWVVSPSPVAFETLLPSEREGFTRNVPGSLPSRAAENLAGSAATSNAPKAPRASARLSCAPCRNLRPELPLLADVRDYLEPLGFDADAAIPPGLVSTFDRAVSSAGQIRDRFSPDGWLALRDLSKTVHKFATTVAPGDDATRAMTVILRKLAGFSGLLHENMYRFSGWRFLEIGRRLERGIHIARMLGLLARKAAPDGALDMMLEIGDSVMTHRRQYTVQSGRRTVVDLLALDPLNPRSVLFQLDG